MANELKPIRTKADYEKARVEVEHRWGAKSGTPKGDRLDVLATLVDAYEAEHYPMDPPDPVEAIKFRMEQQGLSRKDLEPFIGTRTRVAEVLNRKRSLSIGYSPTPENLPYSIWREFRKMLPLTREFRSNSSQSMPEVMLTSFSFPRASQIRRSRLK